MKALILTALLVVALSAQVVVIRVDPFTGPASLYESEPDVAPAPLETEEPEALQLPAIVAWAMSMFYFPSARIEITDPYLVEVKHDWLLKELEDWKAYMAANKITYVNDTYDCEDFAESFAARCAEHAARDGETRGGILVGTVYQLLTINYGFGEVPVGAHAFNIAVTPEGWFLIEPQSGDIVPLEANPHLDLVFMVKFGS